MRHQIDEYYNQAPFWQKEMQVLRSLALGCSLSEEFKWKQACYTFQNKNIFIISAFKNYCALNFFKGALLSDTENILIKAGENSQAGRQLRFTSVKEIVENEAIIKAYIFEAIEIEKAGLEINYKKTAEFDVPEELQEFFSKDKKFEKAFKSLTPGRQRGYLLFFAAAKQSKTKNERIEKYVGRIMNGKGIHDCVCGLSKKMPNCDGSHKQLKENQK
ncbi:MAG: YdeI/OmpD-associated family protein [Flavobacteriales bacterium]|nr:YdeI/OmpD-associated family protein [Flavobacteriales bacterium]